MATDPSARLGELDLYDDLPIHQHADVVRRPASRQWNWTERWYFNIQRRSGELLGIVGGGIFPNTGISESYLCLLDDESQHNYRATQQLAKDPLTSDLLQFAVSNPMLEWSIRSANDDLDTRVSLDFSASGEPFLFDAFWAGPDRETSEFDQYEHFVQPGTLDGSIIVAGTEVSSESHLSFRDRTWGVRSRRPKMHNWIVIHLPDSRYLTLVHQELADERVLFSTAGLYDGAGRFERLEVERHELRFDPVTRVPLEGEFVLRGADGPRKITLSAHGPTLRVLGAGYDDTQGSDRGDETAISSSIWDLADPDVRRKGARGTMDTGVRCLLETDEDQSEGVGVWETAIGYRHRRYGQQLEGATRR
jgi:hypothetical protein